MKHIKLLSFTLAASMLAGLVPTAVFADSFTADESSDQMYTSSGFSVLEAGATDQQDDRVPTQVHCGLTLHEKVDGVETHTLQYDPSKEEYHIQVGGSLDLKSVWSKYNLFKTLYLVKNPGQGGVNKLRAKSLVGDYVFEFHVNTNVIDVDQSKLCDPEAWQQAFRDGSPDAETFFNYMKCTDVTYSEQDGTGTVKVIFKIDENGTNKVSLATIEDNTGKGSKPQNINAYSPEGSFTIKKAKFQNVTAVPDTADFNGDIDLDPWMALVFPIHFYTQPVDHQSLVLIGKPENTGGNTGGSGGSSSNKPVANDYPLYRLYNPNSGEHFYTEAIEERDHLIKVGWNDEGIGWYSPKTSSYPVYRLYNPNAGDHHFTMMKEEKDELSKIGWKYEGISWYSLPANQGVKVYREYNPNAKMAGAHNYTTNKVENDYLVSIGWLDEGIAWWATKAGK